jgi:hypothetical protein
LALCLLHRVIQLVKTPYTSLVDILKIARVCNERGELSLCDLLNLCNALSCGTLQLPNGVFLLLDRDILRTLLDLGTLPLDLSVALQQLLADFGLLRPRNILTRLLRLALQLQQSCGPTTLRVEKGLPLIDL